MSTRSSSAVSMGDYAPSPNTCSMALMRANQLHVQNLLRQLLAPALEKQQDNDNGRQLASEAKRVDVLRVLRRTLREQDFELSWLVQVDFFETIERILREDYHDQAASSDSWRLIDDATKLLVEAIPKFRFDIEQQTLWNILASVVQNLGHLRSEVRRSSLLLINMYLQERPQEFGPFLKLFIEYGLANQRNQQAQRGAILSLPLLMSEQVVGGQNLGPLIGCLGELLVDSANSRLFYSLFLALQRLHLTIGDRKFANYLAATCSPEAAMLYKQAASRSNSLATGQPQPTGGELSDRPAPQQQQQQQDGQEEFAAKQVTFDTSEHHEPQISPGQRQRKRSSSAEDSSRGGSPLGGGDASARPAAEQAPPCATDDSASEASQQQQQPRSSQRPTSSVSSTCSSEAHLVDPSHYMSEAALSGRPLSGLEARGRQADHSSTGLTINDLSTCCTPTFELGPGAENELKFGIFPRHLVWVVLNNNPRQQQRPGDRLEALQELMCIVRESPINHLAILMTYFDSFLEQFLGRLLEPAQSTDHKLELAAIDMIETIVVKTKLSTIQYVRPIVGLLARTMGDSRQLFRDNNVRVLHKMMAYLPPQHVIDALLEHKHHRQASVREECINRVTGAVLEYDKQEFNLTKLCYHVLPMLADHHAGVRLAALECIAVLAHALGPERIGSLLTAAEAVQTGCDYDGLLDAIHARLLRRALPRCHSDGSIGHLIKPFLNLANASFHREHQAADVRWILEAPSSHQHVLASDHHAAGELAAAAAGTSVPPPPSHAHRSGLYSPPPADLQRRQQQQQQMRRRSSLTHLVRGPNLSSSSNESSASNEPHHHHHPHPHHQHNHRHHHHHHHPTTTTTDNDNDIAAAAAHADRPNDHRTSASGLGESSAVEQESLSAAAPAARARKQSSAAAARGEANNPATRMSSLSKLSSVKATESEISNGAYRRDSSSSEARLGQLDSLSSPSTSKLKSSPTSSSASSANVERQAKDKAGAASGRRSYSQDSAASSSDTNKVLFQYYLGKFRQSLNPAAAATSISISSSNNLTRCGDGGGACSGKTANTTTAVLLPSDSLIYTDTDQAFAMTQHRTRQQQTSFDYDTDSVGQIPMGPAESRKTNSKQQHRKSLSSKTTVLADSSGDQSNEPSPLNCSSGNESPQTVIEQQQQQQQRRQSLRGRGQRTEEGPAKQQAGGQPATSERRKSLAKQRASAAGLGQAADAGADAQADGGAAGGRDGGEGELIHQISSATTTSRPRSNSERLVRDKSKSRPATRKGELTRQYASMVADYAPSGESSNNVGPASPASSRHASRDQADDEQTEMAEQREAEQRASRARSSRRPSQPADQIEQAAAAEPPADTETAEDSRVGGQDQEIGRRRASRSQPPVSRHSTGGEGHHDETAAMRAPSSGPDGSAQPRRAVSVSPSLSSSINIRHILENVADIEGPFQDPQLALKVSMEALEGPCWSTKVEGMLALIRLASYHQPEVLAHLHEIVAHTANETRNLRSTVARSAIFTLADLCAKLKRFVEPELDLIVQALLNKSIENTAFIRDDIRRALSTMLEHLTQWRLANSLLNHGANHKNVHVRRMASQFVARLVDGMGAAKCLVGARDISAQLIPAAARFAQDNSPHTRYYGRLIFSKLMHHAAFERLLRKNLPPNLYRSTLGIIESVKRRGAGDPPSEN